MTIDGIERKVALMERHAFLARSGAASEALLRTCRRMTDALGSIDDPGLRERRHEAFRALVRVTHTQVLMWRDRLAAGSN